MTTLPRPLAVISTLLALAHLALAADQIDPWFLPRPPLPGQISIVRYLDQLGPGWAVAFLASGLAITACLIWRPRSLHAAHILAATSVGMYSAAAWAGAYLSAPKGPLVTAILASTVSLAHLVVAWAAARAVAR